MSDDLGVLDAARLLAAGDLSSIELTEACLRRIEERNGGPPTFDGGPDRVNAWARLYPELAREQATAADERRVREGDATPLLCGIPIGLKDLYAVAGLPLTASSRVLEGNVPAIDSTAWQRLREQGMVLLGHTHTHEFAAGGTTDQVGNPWAPERIVGGSSGGSAAALAAGMTPAALGTDTCGSLRIPSACCGTSTIMPSAGRLTLDGVIPLARTLDQLRAGDLARRFGDRGEDELDGADDATISQRLLVMNMDDAPYVDLARTLARSSDRAAVEAAFLVVLTRAPSAEEARRFEERLRGARGEERARRVADLLAALRSTTEAAWNH